MVEKFGIKKALFDPVGLDKEDIFNPEACRLGQHSLKHDRSGNGKDEISGWRRGRCKMEGALEPGLLFVDCNQAAAAESAVNDAEFKRVAYLRAENFFYMLKAAVNKSDCVAGEFMLVDKDQVHACCL